MKKLFCLIFLLCLTFTSSAQFGQKYLIGQQAFGQRYGVSPEGLVLWLDQSDPRSYGDLDNWYDLSGKGNDGSQGTGANQPAITGADGLNGSARSFDGANHYIAVDPIVADIQTDTAGTVSVWINPGTIIGGFHHVFCVADGSEVTAVRLGQSQAKASSALRINGTWQWRNTSTNPVFMVGIWSHVVYVQDGTAPKIYVDSIDQGLDWQTETDKTVWLNGDPDFDRADLGVLAWNSTLAEYYNGLLSNLLVFSRALTAAEIQRLYLADVQRHGGI